MTPKEFRGQMAPMTATFHTLKSRQNTNLTQCTNNVCGFKHTNMVIKRPLSQRATTEIKALSGMVWPAGATWSFLTGLAGLALVQVADRYQSRTPIGIDPGGRPVLVQDVDRY